MPDDLPAFLNYSSGSGTANGVQGFSQTPAAPPAPSPVHSTPAQRSIAVGYNPFWVDSPQQWNTCVLQGIALPGVASVRAGVGRKLDVQSPPGSDGANIRDKGYLPKPLNVELVMWSADQFNTWEQMNLSMVARRRQRTPLTIAHPSLNSLGIRQVYLQNCGNLRQGSKPGLMTVEIEFIEYCPPTPSPPQQTAPASSSFGNRASFGETPAQQLAMQQNDPQLPTAPNGSWTTPNSSTLAGVLPSSP